MGPLDDIPLASLLAVLVFLIILSGFFSGSETALMALNRYRLKNLADQGHQGALLAKRLLSRPDQLIGVILLGNNSVNILASSLATIIGYRLFQEIGIAMAAGLLTVVILIFAEVAPKTMAAIYPEKIAFPAAYVLTPLLAVFSSVVFIITLFANGLLYKVLRIKPRQHDPHTLSQEELRTVVQGAGSLVPDIHRKMLLSILDLGKATVEDIMIPKSEVVGIDLKNDWGDVVNQIIHAPHTRLPVYRETIDDIVGLAHIKYLLKPIENNTLSEAVLCQQLRKPYFIPEKTLISKQLLNFRKEKRRTALVVDEYGDIQGLVTLEDVLEEIVGQFATGPEAIHQDVFPQADGSYLINATITVRELKRILTWDLPVDGPKTLNGVIVEYMQDIPQPGTSMRLYGRAIEILQTYRNSVKSIKLYPVAV